MLLKKIMKKIIVGLIAVVMILTAMIPTAGFANAESKVKKPARVKLGKTTVNTKTRRVTIRWKKAKRAEMYQVYMKQGAKKWKSAKFIIGNKYTSKKLKLNVRYRFKVRGISEKAYGKFSKVKKVVLKKNKKGKIVAKVTTEAPNEIVEAGDTGPKEDLDILTLTIDGKAVTYKVGGTYSIPTPGGPETVKITNLYVQDWGDYKSLRGILPDGMDIGIEIENGKVTGFWKGDVTDWETNPPSNPIKYWTIDGTEPQVGQADLFYEGEIKTYWHGGPMWDGQLRGTKISSATTPDFGDWDTINTATGKKTYIASWQKMYKDGKLLHESYGEVAQYTLWPE